MTEAGRVAFFLGHVLEAIARIERYTGGLDEAAFLSNPMAQDAVIRNFEIIGEACNNVRKADPALVAAHPEVPWSEVIAQRNLLSHGYFAVDMQLVWTTLKQDLPALRKAIAGLLP
ncbi:MAG: DUF86 domain-containing protein [Variovorax sp.]|nr:MAG: DUF86 domain-containing protein [Variovorax sp.]